MDITIRFIVCLVPELAYSMFFENGDDSVMGCNNNRGN